MAKTTRNTLRKKSIKRQTSGTSRGQQGSGSSVSRASGSQANNRDMVSQLLDQVNWSKLLPVVIPLLLSVLRKRRPTVAAQQTQSQQTDPMIGLLGALLGGGASNAQPQMQGQQADPLGGLLGALMGGGASSAQTQMQGQQADPLGGLLGALMGGGADTAQTQMQQQQAQQQANPLGGLLGALGSGQGSQLGGLLGLLGTSAQANQSRVGTQRLLDGLASNVDLDGDGVPDALEKSLNTPINTPTQRAGAASLLEQLLDEASPEERNSFTRAAQSLLSTER